MYTIAADLLRFASHKRSNGTAWASPIGVDGKVYIASEHGKFVVLRAAGDWEILAINEFDSDLYATPAISAGQIYIRTQNALYAIGSPNSGAKEFAEKQ